MVSEYEHLDYLEEASKMQKEYKKVLQAIDQVRQKGYGVVTPERSEIELEAPEVIRHGSKYGVKIKAKSPSIHMIRANIETEIAPIVGTKEQAEDLIGYIGHNEETNSISHMRDAQHENCLRQWLRKVVRYEGYEGSALHLNHTLFLVIISA